MRATPPPWGVAEKNAMETLFAFKSLERAVNLAQSCRRKEVRQCLENDRTGRDIRPH